MGSMQRRNKRRLHKKPDCGNTKQIFLIYHLKQFTHVYIHSHIHANYTHNTPFYGELCKDIETFENYPMLTRDVIHTFK